MTCDLCFVPATLREGVKIFFGLIVYLVTDFIFSMGKTYEDTPRHSKMGKAMGDFYTNTYLQKNLVVQDHLWDQDLLGHPRKKNKKYNLILRNTAVLWK